MSMTKIEIIDETVEFYKNNLRSASPDTDRCQYHGPNGSRCAFSRCCYPEIDLSEFEGQGCLIILDKLGDKILQEKYQGHSANFWAQIQIYHDTILNMNDEEQEEWLSNQKAYYSNK